MQQEHLQGVPIYLQIFHTIRQEIASGIWISGMRFPPVRELSLKFGVNPNTAQRALAELEREGLVYVEGTIGRFITKDNERIAGLQQELAQEYTGQFYAKMKALGYTAQQMQVCIEEIKKMEGETV